MYGINSPPGIVWNPPKAAWNHSLCECMESIPQELHVIRQRRHGTRSEIDLYQQACDWIEKNSERAITSQEVAMAVGCSRAYLNRSVKSACGECLSAVIARHRLERIKNLCDSGNMSVSEIASRLNFYSAELLCKFFKYHEGISINIYRLKVKK